MMKHVRAALGMPFVSQSFGERVLGRQRQTERLNEKRRRGGCSAPASVNEAPAQPCPGHQRAASCNAHQTFTYTDRPRATLCRFSRTAKRCRSEEPTSELQSLMRNSYADYCLTKITNTI